MVLQKLWDGGNPQWKVWDRRPQEIRTAANG
jgi:hypothetical protein